MCLKRLKIIKCLIITDCRCLNVYWNVLFVVQCQFTFSSNFAKIFSQNDFKLDAEPWAIKVVLLSIEKTQLKTNQVSKPLHPYPLKNVVKRILTTNSTRSTSLTSMLYFV